jgi:hypothetical protein
MNEPVPAPRSRADVRHAWAERLRRFADSGLAAAPFCAQEGVSLASFYLWRRRLTQPPAGPAAPRGPRLLPVRLAAAPAPFELALPSGAVLRVGPGADPAALAELLRLLGALPC